MFRPDDRHMKEHPMALPAQNLEYSLLQKDEHTEEEYFAWEDFSPDRWEWIPEGILNDEGRRLGVIRAMSGGTVDHGGTQANIIRALGNALRASGRRRCRVFTSDVKVHCPNGRNTYPDASVVCGPPQLYGGRNDIVLNPTLLVEVLSPSTEGDDRGAKWQSYQRIPTLQHYLLVSPDGPRVEVYSRENSGWHFAASEGLDAEIPLPALGVTLPLSEIYYEEEVPVEDADSAALE